MKLILRIAINAVALWLAAYLVNGIELSNDWVNVLIVALVFGLVNAVIKPITKLFSLPFIILTLGLFTLVINALMLWLTSGITDSLQVAGFAPAFWGGLVISVVSFVLSNVLDDDDRRAKQKRKERRNA